MRKWFIFIGLAVFAGILFWPWLQRLGLGKLPGDIQWERNGKRIQIPIVSVIVLITVFWAVSMVIRRIF